MLEADFIKSETQLDRLERKMDKILSLLEEKEMPISKDYSVLKVGQLTDEEMKRWQIGPYLNTNSPGSTSS